MNLYLKYNNIEYDLSFDGLKIFQTKKPNWFTRTFFNECIQSKYSNCEIFKNNVIIISDFSKVTDLVSMSKNSEFTKLLISELINNEFLSNKKIDETINKINNLFECEIIQEAIDINKIISNSVELNDDLYLNKKLFLKILDNNMFNEKITFILNDIDWLKTNDVAKYLNSFNFIFVTNDLRKNISTMLDFEACVLLNNKVFEIANYSILISYLEKQLNIIVDEKVLSNFISFSSDSTSISIYENLFNLEKKL